MRSQWSRAVASLRPAADDAPLVGQAPAMTLREVARRFWPYLRPLLVWLLLLLALMLAAPAISVAEVMLFQRLVDNVLVPADIGPLALLAALYVALNLASAVLSGADDYLSTWISQRFLVRLRTDVFRHVLALPLQIHQRRRLGDVLSRITSDVAAVETFMISQLASGLGAVFRLAFFVGALFFLQWELALASMVVAPGIWWITSRFARFVKDVSRERRRRAGSLSSVTEENLAVAGLVQAYHREEDAVAKYHRQNAAIAAAELAASRVRVVFLPLVDLAELVATLAVVGLGVWALSTDRLTLGGLLAFLTLMAQCYGPVRSLGSLLPSLFSATAGVERVVELLDEPVPADRPGATPLVDPRGVLELRGVSARYPHAPAEALSGVSLRIDPGEVVAVVGPSGAGKSTLVRLLTRHLDPSAGSVHFDGRDLRDVTLGSLREAVTVVQQETLLLDASVRDNIAFARPDAPLEDVRRAAVAADADDFISRLPAGYDTGVDQRGQALSGGQRQRIAMARALLRDTPVLVLDEPTTGLDSETSRRVLEPLISARRGRAVVIVTHDPVAIEVADRVVELDQGRVVAQPGHTRRTPDPPPPLGGEAFAVGTGSR